MCFAFLTERMRGNVYCLCQNAAVSVSRLMRESYVKGCGWEKTYDALRKDGGSKNSMLKEPSKRINGPDIDFAVSSCSTVTCAILIVKLFTLMLSAGITLEKKQKIEGRPYFKSERIRSNDPLSLELNL